MANGHREPIPLDDAMDLCDFYEATGRTIPRSKWAAESIALAQQAQIEAMLS